VWQRWPDWDPVAMARQPPYAAAKVAGVPDDRVYFELFDGGHFAIEYRYPLALAWLCRRLAP
jgi:hypothetical protein